jgi:hypothetical protein
VRKSLRGGDGFAVAAEQVSRRTGEQENRRTGEQENRRTGEQENRRNRNRKQLTAF